MNHTPRTEPLGSDDPTRMRSGSGSRSPLYLTVGCASVILGLILGVGGFFGVRAVTDEPTDPPGSRTSDSGGPTTTAVETAPVGRSASLPLRTTFPFVAPDKFPGTAEMALVEVDWDATDELVAFSEFNGEPESGSKYIMVTAEATYRGDGELTPFDWIGLQYVDADGEQHFRAYLLTELDAELPTSVSDGESFREAFVFEVPQGVTEGGHFVVLPDYTHGADEGVWIDAA
ncbi:hypothetical protein [Brachybacterium fresconis]|uniref:DUF4352 domain-containing protein n=1 Tax=Brachybacterium fresconis TaxID=173363 RepID=A0ABS4YKI3_9MICO|nr:hypothetical protein [Brachybacterium fresconis]MBP2409296.1 hypothetical protein [Brachybacterium fresconis]